jgi:hypothetical protein
LVAEREREKESENLALSFLFLPYMFSPKFPLPFVYVSRQITGKDQVIAERGGEKTRVSLKLRQRAQVQKCLKWEWEREREREKRVMNTNCIFRFWKLIYCEINIVTYDQICSRLVTLFNQWQISSKIKNFKSRLLSIFLFAIWK